jgi:hypothetical protein
MSNKTRGRRIVGFLLALVLGGLVLAACGDDPAPGPKDQYVQGAINAVNGGTPLPFPTVDPAKILDLKLILFNADKPIYTMQIDPKTGRRVTVIQFFVLNTGLTTVYISSCEGTVLQRKEGESWVNVASVRPCGSQPQAIAMEAGGQFNLSLELAKAKTYPNQNFDIPGSYRLVVNFSPTCPPARNDFASCLDKIWQASTEFRLQPVPDGVSGGTAPATPTPGK